MQQIPDTGGGLSGFIAWLLWHVYQYFPFKGTWDWLLLFISLALVTRLLAMPAEFKLWRWVYRRDYRSKFFRTRVRFAQLLHHLFVHTGVMFLFIWFFSTDAGHTFLVGRTWFGGIPVLETNTWLLLPSAVLLFIAGSAFASIYRLWAWSGRLSWSWPHLHGLVVVGAHLFYWYWPVASLALMWVFTLVDLVVVAASWCFQLLCRRRKKT